MNLWNIHRGPDTDKPSKLLQQRAKEQKKVAVAKRRKADAKRMITMAEKKLVKTEGNNASNNTVTDNLDFNVVKQNFQPQDVIFEPLPGPQTEFLAAPEREVLFGGAAGGSKTYSLIAEWTWPYVGPQALP